LIVAACWTRSKAHGEQDKKNLAHRSSREPWM
jgi:hypothetical protein